MIFLEMVSSGKLSATFNTSVRHNYAGRSCAGHSRKKLKIGGSWRLEPSLKKARFKLFFVVTKNCTNFTLFFGA